MVSFVSFVALALATMVVASPLELVEKRQVGDDPAGPTVDCKDIYQYVSVRSSYDEGRALASLAADYIRISGTADQIFIDYFGRESSPLPFDIFTAVAMDEDRSTNLTCTDQCFPGVTTFVDSKKINYCPPFFKQGELKDICSMQLIDPGSIRGVTTMTEMTHTLFDMNDSGYWCSSASWMAANHPEIAVMNSGSYACFAMHVYAKTQC